MRLCNGSFTNGWLCRRNLHRCGCGNNGFSRNPSHIHDALLSRRMRGGSVGGFGPDGTIDSGFISGSGCANLSTQERFHAIASMDAVNTPIGWDGRSFFSDSLIKILHGFVAESICFCLFFAQRQAVKRIVFLPECNERLHLLRFLIQYPGQVFPASACFCFPMRFHTASISRFSKYFWYRKLPCTTGPFSIT